MSLPLFVKDGVAGAISLVARPGRTYDANDLDLAEELARRTSLALENARLYWQIQRALAARDEFLTVAAHEIRGPLTALHLTIQSLKNGADSPVTVARLLKVIEREDRRLAQFVDELLDLGRIQSGRLQLEIETVDLSDLARDVASRMGAQLEAAGSALAVTTEGRVEGQWDRFRIEQIVSNLLSNAAKFGLGNPITLTVRGSGERGILMVKDRGTGVSPELGERIFKPFERGVSARHYGGLGVGLYIVHSIVTALGGTIRVDSTEGKGSTFTVELPRTRAT
jgi:signal transduction histidine kinase